MADLSVEFAGIQFKNPILIGSSSLTNHVEKMKRLEQAGAGGIVTKLISNAVQPPEHNYPFRCVVLNEGWTVMGDQNLDLDYGTSLVKEAKKQLKIPIIVNFVGIEDNEDNWVENRCALPGEIRVLQVFLTLFSA